MKKINHSELEKIISYRFKSRSFLDEACRHSSYVNEQPDAALKDNERLEFLGDAVLNLVIGHLLMEEFPDIPEGNLSRMRAQLVNETQLAKTARRISLGRYLHLGKGEIQTNGQDKNSILADAFEALIAAIYLDGGFDQAFRFVRDLFTDVVVSKAESAIHNDYKSKLQEVVQTSRKTMPAYEVLEEQGPDHDKTFLVGISVGDLSAEGSGKSKKLAEQDAARRLLKLLNPS